MAGHKRPFVSLACLLAVAAACSTNEPTGTVDHIILITVDTLRADHVGVYGYPRATTPFIDALAESGYLFERAYSQSSTTSPAHASIFTGLYPRQHGRQCQIARALVNFLILRQIPASLRIYTLAMRIPRNPK